MKAKAGLTTPNRNSDRQSGLDINPGSDDEETDDEADINDLQGNDNLEPSEETSDPPVEALSRKFEEAATLEEKNQEETTNDNEFDEDTMRGFFIQPNVRDPHDFYGEPRDRLCCYALLASGIDTNLVEIGRPATTDLVFSAPLNHGSGNARTALGVLGRRDQNMIGCFQEQIDKKLLKQQGAYRSVPWNTKIQLPGSLRLERHYLDPKTNLRTRDPVFPTRIPSRNPMTQSDAFYVFCFIFLEKKTDGLISRGDRDRTSRLMGNDLGQSPDWSEMPSLFEDVPIVNEGLGNRSYMNGRRNDRSYYENTTYAPQGMNWEQSPSPIPPASEVPRARFPPNPVQQQQAANNNWNYSSATSTNSNEPRPPPPPMQYPRNHEAPPPPQQQHYQSQDTENTGNTGNALPYFDANSPGPVRTRAYRRDRKRRERDTGARLDSPRRRQQLNDGSGIELSAEVQYSYDDDTTSLYYMSPNNEASGTGSVIANGFQPMNTNVHVVPETVTTDSSSMNPVNRMN